MRYALDAMMLEVGSFPNSKSWKEAKKEVDKVWTPQMRELFAAESGNTVEERERSMWRGCWLGWRDTWKEMGLVEMQIICQCWI